MFKVVFLAVLSHALLSIFSTSYLCTFPFVWRSFVALLLQYLDNLVSGFDLVGGTLANLVLTLVIGDHLRRILGVCCLMLPRRQVVDLVMHSN